MYVYMILIWMLNGCIQIYFFMILIYSIPDPYSKKCEVFDIIYIHEE